MVSLLPCSNDPLATNQISPAIDMLQRMDREHPDVLAQHGLAPGDYHSKLVFRSNIRRSRRMTRTTRLERILVMQKAG